jgi:8-oxo-dGTP diphosphatase
VYTKRSAILIVVGAAIVADGRVLACERANPPEVSGKWEFPGGKRERGESDHEALIRECVEELGVHIEPGEQLGQDISLAGGRALLRVYNASLCPGEEPVAREHSALRWLGPEELDSVPWLPADAPIVAALAPLLRDGAGQAARGNGPEKGHG